MAAQRAALLLCAVCGTRPMAALKATKSALFHGREVVDTRRSDFEDEPVAAPVTTAASVVLPELGREGLILPGLRGLTARTSLANGMASASGTDPTLTLTLLVVIDVASPQASATASSPTEAASALIVSSQPSLRSSPTTAPSVSDSSTSQLGGQASAMLWTDWQGVCGAACLPTALSRRLCDKVTPLLRFTTQIDWPLLDDEAGGPEG